VAYLRGKEKDMFRSDGEARIMKRERERAHYLQLYNEGMAVAFKQDVLFVVEMFHLF
jgi:hypothetical protein